MVLDVLLKVSLNRILKFVFVVMNVVLMAVTSFGTLKVVSASAILKGLTSLFDVKDVKVCLMVKDIMVEMMKWLGV